jgi:acyl-CoA thioesterase-1
MTAAALLRALIAIFIATALLQGCDKGPRIAKLAPGEVVVAFGDSLTFGTGASEAESYPAVLAQLTGLRVIRAGVPGEVTAQGLQRLPDVIEEHKPKLVIVCLGGNDLLRKLGPAQTKANMRSIITLLKDKGIAVVLVGVPEPALFASAPPFYAELAQELKVPYEGAIVKSVLYGTDTRADPIHPNAKGYRRMAEAIAALLKSSGAI